MWLPLVMFHSWDHCWLSSSAPEALVSICPDGWAQNPHFYREKGKKTPLILDKKKKKCNKSMKQDHRTEDFQVFGWIGVWSYSAVAVILHTQQWNAECLLNEDEQKLEGIALLFRNRQQGLFFGVIKFHKCLFRKKSILFAVFTDSWRRHKVWGKQAASWEQLGFRAGL